MEKITAIIVAIIVFTNVSVQTLTAQTVENKDTIKIYNNPSSIIITENGGETRVEVIDNVGNLELTEARGDGNSVIKSSTRFNRISTGCCGKWHFTTNGLYFGFVSTPGTSESVSPDMGKSMEIGWLNIVALERALKNGWAVGLGVGIDWRNYRSTRGLIYESHDNHASVTTATDPNYRFSRIKIFSVQFPLLWTKQFKKVGGMTPGIGFGAIFNLNTHGSIKTSWKNENGKKENFTNNEIGQRRFTIDLYGQVRWGDLGLYLRYSPYKILTRSEILDYRPLSVGVTLFY